MKEESNGRSPVGVGGGKGVRAGDLRRSPVTRTAATVWRLRRRAARGSMEKAPVMPR